MISLLSPKLKKLCKDFLSGNEASLFRFFDSLKEYGTPIIENRDTKTSFVTFIYENNSNIEKLAVLGEFCGFSFKKNELSLFWGAFWYRTYVLPKDTTSLYYFSINGHQYNSMSDRYENLVKDPLNPKILFFPSNEASILELPLALKESYLKALIQEDSGKIFKLDMNTGEPSPQTQIHLTKDFNPDNPYKFVIFLDGTNYLEMMNAPLIIDNMKKEGKIQGLVSVFLPSGENRFENYTLKDSFNDYICDILIPLVSHTLNIHPPKEDTYVCGLSLGGLAACYLTLKNSNIFNGAISQSGSFWYEKESPSGELSLLDLYQTSPHLPLRLYISVGKMEVRKMRDHSTNMLEANKAFKKLLFEKGYIVTYNEFAGGHDLLCWRKELPAILSFIAQ